MLFRSTLCWSESSLEIGDAVLGKNVVPLKELLDIAVVYTVAIVVRKNLCEVIVELSSWSLLVVEGARLALFLLAYAVENLPQWNLVSISIHSDVAKTCNTVCCESWHTLPSVIDTKGSPMMDQMSTLITSCMTGDLTKLDADFAVNVEESVADYRLTIVPKSKTVRAYIDKMVILLNRKDLSVNRLTMYENASDYTMYDFTDKKFNAAIPQTVFNMR